MPRKLPPLRDADPESQRRVSTLPIGCIRNPLDQKSAKYGFGIIYSIRLFSLVISSMTRHLSILMTSLSLISFVSLHSPFCFSRIFEVSLFPKSLHDFQNSHLFPASAPSEAFHLLQQRFLTSSPFERVKDCLALSGLCTSFGCHSRRFLIASLASLDVSFYTM